jgi:hypothetical protein
MGAAIPLLVLALAYLAWLQGIGQNLALGRPNGPTPARQIAYNMRLYHQAAVALKSGDTAQTMNGVLAVTPPGFLTDGRFTSCAASKSVVTYSNGLNLAQSRDVTAELLRQSVVPPELGGGNTSPLFPAVDGASGPLAGYAAGIGISDGSKINNGFGSLVPACAVPAGLAAIQTQVLP